MLLLYPGITSRIFQMFRCFKVPGTKKQVLMYDFSVDCVESSEYQGHFVVAMVAVGVFAVGVPLLLFVELWRHRAHLHLPIQDDHLSKHVKHYHVRNRLGSFYEHYDRVCVSSVSQISRPVLSFFSLTRNNIYSPFAVNIAHTHART